jgi:small subunit ribosomal protein S16
MSVKLRLLRKGRKRKPFYYVVAADSRAPRDGRYIERIGSYNPNTDPATIDIDLDLSVKWLQDGAQPTDTVRGILSYKGAMHKDHLIRGAAKGAFPEEEIESRFTAWLSEKEGRIQAKRDRLADAKSSSDQERHERESKIRKAREEAIIAKNTPPAEEISEEPAAEVAEGEEAVAVEETVVAEDAAVAEEAPAVEEEAVADETSVEETITEETTTEENPTEETPVDEAPAVEEEVIADETSADETPVVDEAPDAKEAPDAEETPAAEEEAPAAEEVEVAEEAAEPKVEASAEESSTEDESSEEESPAE